MKKKFIRILEDDLESMGEDEEEDEEAIEKKQAWLKQKMKDAKEGTFISTYKNLLSLSGTSSKVA